MIDDVQIRALFIKYGAYSDRAGAIAAMTAKLSTMLDMEARHVLSSSYLGNSLTFKTGNELETSIAPASSMTAPVCGIRGGGAGDE
jgi:hypothetical protein